MKFMPEQHLVFSQTHTMTILWLIQKVRRMKVGGILPTLLVRLETQKGIIV